MCAQRGRCSVIGDGSGCRTLVPLLLCVHSAVAVQFLVSVCRLVGMCVGYSVFC